MPRMPQVEDFPKPVQDQIRQQQRGEAAVQDPRRKSIFERLASFGASRQEETLHSPPPPPVTAYAPTQRGPVAHNAPTPQHVEYAKRPIAPGPQSGFDLQGRRAAPPRQAEEDHLEIPAFLRRQSNS
jgi:cell division protein FtsZ